MLQGNSSEKHALKMELSGLTMNNLSQEHFQPKWKGNGRIRTYCVPSKDSLLGVDKIAEQALFFKDEASTPSPDH